MIRLFDGNYKIAELSGREEAVEAIRKLEQALTEQFGSSITLIAYEAEDEQQ